jgi:shikimate kinase
MPRASVPASELPGASPADRHVVLVGMMGSGKSTVGPQLAEQLGRQYADVDELVEAATKLTVREIFETEGEDEFRRLEGVLLHHALNVSERGVIGCGGGIVTQPGQRQLLRDGRGFVVWLRATPEVLAGRLVGVADRPLLDGDPEGSLRRLAAERAGWYDEVADFVLDVDDLDVGSTVDAIAKVVNG